MIFNRSKASFAAIFLFLACAGGHGQEVKRGNSEGISTKLSVSNEHPVPYESLLVVISLQNETGQAKRVIAAWRVGLDIADVKGERAEWRTYTPDNEPIASPPIPSALDFAPGEIKRLYGHIDYDALSRQHVFARPGSYRLRAAASYDTRFVSNDVDIVVREPEGLDAKAYEFLQKSNVHRFFSESTVEKYPRTYRNARALEQFINKFEGSEYSSHGRLGLALMWIKGVNEKIDLFRARELLTQVTQKAKDPLASRAHYYLGTIWQKRGDTVRAREAFQAVLKGNPDPYFRFLAEQELASTK